MRSKRKHTTEQITLTIGQVTRGSEQQNEGVSESVKALEEVASGIQQIAESASMIAESSTITIQKAHSGGESVNKTVQQMSSIQDSVLTSNQMIKSLEDRSKAIGQIIEVITGIADQTNLLALNAAIEAARAGEHGRGFAVVADEVRKLAEESKQSSNQIGILISEIQRDMARSIDGMNQVTYEVKEGLEIANTTKTNFVEIMEATNLVSEQIDNMAATAEQISAGSQEVTSSFMTIAEISKQASTSTQEVAASAEEQVNSMEEITSSAQSLSDMAVDLREMIKRFKI
ncbi:methyl-accepting chemotaxis protein [Metabacillus bambusae]|uniref:Methyl-accepting chemotaxis protein n=1 Tax=Metabacillus bambusae TaxID=2795218 RepID=A0ABS3MW26_9BACI|nr:methyl-accepting chemotaxis protein [Metabacillus bambusae]MBO1510207.1 methyl-accepting chemotaxis protein [Metabacillus bambusae]